MDIEFAYAIAANHTDRTPSELLTAEMLPLHGLIREDLEYSSAFHPSETLDRLAGYIFLNMERMEDILMLWRERRIPDPEQIELLLNEVDARSLMRGAL